MNYSVFRFTLNMHNHRSQVAIPVFLGDTGIRLLISITDGGTPYFIEDGCTAYIRGKKADGKGLFNQCLILNNTTIQYDFTKQTSNCEGITTCEIELYGKDGTLITAPKFIIVVDSRSLSDSEIAAIIEESDAEVSIIPKVIATIESEDARVEAETSRVNAEADRVMSEEEREVNEAGREVNEAGRVKTEQERVTAEESRAEAERLRAEAESKRITFDEAVSLSESMFASANLATEAADRVEAIKSGITRNSKRITNLERGIVPSPFETDSNVAYIKDVPENALPYAAISKIGGMTRKCNNLLNIPKSGTETQKGLTLTYNGDGTFTINGTATEDAVFFYQSGYKLPKGDYFLKTNGTGMGWNSYWGGYHNEQTNKEDWDVGSGVKITSENNTFTLFLKVSSGKTLENKVFKPMINAGKTALPFEPYFKDLRDAKVTAVKSIGANLADLEYNTATVTPTIEKTPSKLSLTVNSASTIYFRLKTIPVEVGKTYTIRGNVTGGTSYGLYLHNATDNQNGAVYGNLKGENSKVTFTATTPELVLQGYIKWASETAEKKTITFENVMLNKGTEPLPFTPYGFEYILEIPEAVQSLEGYGQSNPDNAEEYNYIDFDNFISCGHIVDGVWVAYESKQKTDISDLITDDNLIGVEGCGTIIPVNEYGYAVPWEVIYQLKEVAV